MKNLLTPLLTAYFLLFTAINFELRCQSSSLETDEHKKNDYNSDYLNIKDEIANCGTGHGGTEIHNRPQIDNSFPLFTGGTEGYDSYRIPSIISTRNGVILAFCEGRKNNSEDYGDIDVVYKRSTDNGRTWSGLKVLFENGIGTCGSPTSLIDAETGNIWIFMSYNDGLHSQKKENGLAKGGLIPIEKWGDRKVYSSVSKDEGLTWEPVVDRTKELLPNDFAWDAIGPGNGIQVKYGTNKNRLLIPAIKRIIYSDDNGTTWNYYKVRGGTSEGTIVELCDNKLMRNDKASNPEMRKRKRRQISTSSDNGLSWSNWESDEKLLDPSCQASILRYNVNYPPRILFLNPSSTVGRRKMRIRISYDEGKTWPVQRLLDKKRGGYSSMAKTNEPQIALLYEIGGKSKHNRSIIFRKLNLSWILNGTPEPLN